MRHGIIRTTRLGLNPDPDITSLSTASTLVNDANYNLKMLRQSSDPLISVVDDDFPVIMPDTDYWWYNTFTGATNRTTAVLAVNAQRFFPFYIRENLRTDRLRLLNTTTATGSFAIAIYDAHPTTKLPRNRLLEFLSINTSSHQYDATNDLDALRTLSLQGIFVSQTCDQSRRATYSHTDKQALKCQEQLCAMLKQEATVHQPCFWADEDEYVNYDGGITYTRNNSADNSRRRTLGRTIGRFY
jgi:hypothetical protein